MFTARQISIGACLLFLLGFAFGCDGAPAARDLGDSGGTVADGAAADGASDAADGEQPDGDSPDDGGVDPVDAEDGGTADGRAADGMVSDGMSTVDGGASDTDDTSMDASGPCGGEFCTDGQICNNGTCECPQYHELCDGECVAVNLDPDNCGGCADSPEGEQCTGDEVCNLGDCTTDCPEGTEPCNGRCVDTDISDDHCGTCNNSCANDQACNFGNCVDTVPVDAGNKTCDGGGDPVDVEFPGQRTEKTCSGAIAKTTFRWGICSCNGIDLKNNLEIDAFDSRLGPYEPRGIGGSLGSNGKLEVDKGQVFGSVWTSYTGDPAYQSGNPGVDVSQQFHAASNVRFNGGGKIGGDAYADGSVKGRANMQQTLHVPDANQVGPRISYASLSEQSVNVSTVCKRCEQDRQIPVQTIVEIHETNNDNDVINLDENALDQPGDRTVLQLPCGKYYLSKVDVDNQLVIKATGRTALFINGDVISDQSIKILPTQRGELDVFVNGKVDLASNIQVGSTAYPASTRFYVNGEWTFQNDGVVGAYIYAIPGGISLMNNLVMYGGMYTQKLGTKNNIDVHYDRAVLEADRQCPDPDDNTGGGGDMDAGMDGGTADDGGTTGDDGGSSTDDGGTTGDDGGTTDSGTTCASETESCSADGDCCSDLVCGTDSTCQTPCSDQGGSCNSDGDCCSPLVCASDDTCQTDSCNNLYEECSTDSDCCSGTCAQSSDPSICISG